LVDSNDSNASNVQGKVHSSGSHHPLASALAPQLMAGRHIQPVALRQFLRWLTQDAEQPGSSQGAGWGWALLLSSGGFFMIIVHHQFFWWVDRATGSSACLPGRCMLLCTGCQQ
jgi:hypothetical protein